jgi:DNA-binding MarR family transcriptional regulator
MSKPNIGLLLKQIYLEYTRLMDGKVGQYGISSSQAEALYYISMDEGLSQSQLKKHLGISAASLSSLVDSLATKQLAERKPDPSDPRRIKLYLTKKSKAFVGEIVDIKQAIYAGFNQSMSPAQLALFAEWLEQFLSNVKQQSQQ